ncbi:lantibiotic dehydratase C-terminal domain-containing protein [Micromonospora echinospora]|uniref:lantibiotic dehydratase C-terminal domain-containing protein n=1 Tax=Micromonospora echinospora TaxID=1877 RepID=UPI00366AF47F
MSTTRSWTSVHVFYDGDLDVVVTDLVATLTTRVAHLHRGLFFLRYWDGGPHLRIRILSDDGRRPEIHGIVAEATRDFLRRRPAPAGLDQDRYAQQAARLAEVEGLHRYERVRRPGNSLAFVPYQPETHRYGTGPQLHAVEDHPVRCSTAVRRLLTAGPSTADRRTVAYAVLVLGWWTAWTVGGTPPAVDPTLVGVDDDRDLDGFRRQRGSLLELTGRMRALATAPPEQPVGILGTWARSLATLAGRIDDPAAVWPLLDACTHLACNRLGVHLAEEENLRRLAHRALAELLLGEVTR